MKIAVIQNKVYENISQTLENINLLLDKANLENIDFLVFPEMFTTPYENKYFIKYSQKEDSLILDFLNRVSLKYNTYIIGGSIPFIDDGKIFNSTFVFNRDGKIIARYDKIHLFEIEYPDGTKFSENEVFTPGSKLGIFDTEFGQMGVMICFDIRFPYLASKLMEVGAKVIFVPAAFNTFTGPLHWRTTFRARAIDNQLFLVGASPSSDSYGSYKTYGHSIVVNPLGKVLYEFSDLESMIVIDLDLSQIDKARQTIPIIKNMKKI